jgi:multiple sugar transport system permease protein/raffinose/stachyose/melibiose transport system permease protein
MPLVEFFSGAAPDRARSRLRHHWNRLQRRLDPYADYLLLAAPGILLVVVLGLPVLFNVYISFFSWSGTGWPTEFVGLSNYMTIFTDSSLIRSVTNTLVWTVGMVTVPPAVGLGTALLIDDLYGERFFKTAFFLPKTISFVAIGIMWTLMYNNQFGVVNSILGAVGLGELARAWLGIPTINTFAMMVAQGWLFSATAMLVYLAGLRSIPNELYEAAEIDGLSRAQQFRYVTLPLLRPFTTFVVATILFNVLKIFDIIWVMTRGGPFFTSETLAVSMYRISFSQFQFGLGAAVANVLTVLIVVVTVLYIQYNIKREVEY